MTTLGHGSRRPAIGLRPACETALERTPAPCDLILLAASAGGVWAIREIVSAFPKDLPAAVIVAQHRSIRSQLVSVLKRRSRLPVREVVAGEPVRRGIVYVAPPDRHLIVDEHGCFATFDGRRINYLLSSADPLFETAAVAFDGRVIAVVLSGAGRDAADGVCAVKRHGGTVVAQDATTAEFFAMPDATIRTGVVDQVLPLSAIGPRLTQLVMAGRDKVELDRPFLPAPAARKRGTPMIVGAPMIEIKRILCPIDLSEDSRPALAHALALAAWYGARVTVLHTFEPSIMPFALGFDPGGQALPEPATVEAEVKLFVAASENPGVPVQIEVAEGGAARTILSRTRASKWDLIVMGTHGRAGAERLLLGSVAEKVLRKATMPVLVVPPSAPPAVRGPFRSVVSPTDFSPASLKGLEYALSIAKEADARLTLLHVVDTRSEEPLEMTAFEAPDIREAMAERSLASLGKLVPADAPDWCRPSLAVRFGSAADEILRLAHERSADLIVMGLTGRGSVDLALFGSTTNHVVRKAPCPVLAVHGG